jgi:pancreatic triacylglycerol lipase
MIYAHGYLESSLSPSVKSIVDAYSSRGGWNVIVIDWSKFSRGNYLTVLPQLKNVGLSVSEYLAKFIKAGYPFDKIYLVGNYKLTKHSNRRLH